MTAATTLAAWRRINWKQVCLHLRSHYKPLARVAKEIGAKRAQLSRIVCDKTREPSDFETGLKLLDLHLDRCPELHTPALIMFPQEGVKAR